MRCCIGLMIREEIIKIIWTMAENERNNKLNDDERQYLEMMQGNIERMAANSANCKTWMVTIVSALMALQCTIQALNGWILLGILPTVLFWYLDVYYLHLERGMRNRETLFVNMIRDNKFGECEDALFNFQPYMIKMKDLSDEDKQNGLVATNDRWFSKSVVPFYGMTLIAVGVVSVVLIWGTIVGWFR